MALTDQEYIALCKKMIERKYPLGNGSEWRQRDLEYLSQLIEDSSGVKLSLSTLKRLWKEDFQQMPHPSTLNALVSVLDYNDWVDFKKNQNLSESDHGNTKTLPAKAKMVLGLVLAVLLAGTLIMFSLGLSDGTSNQGPVISGEVHFVADKTITSDVPNTVIFNYDLSQVKADSFFIQQSWNELYKDPINKDGEYFSSIYYYPGFHRAKLIANDSIIRRARIHIKTKSWLPVVRKSSNDQIPVYIRNEKIASGGKMQITSEDFSVLKLDLSQPYLTSYYNIREFDNLSSDNFFLETKLKCDSVSASVACPEIVLTIVCEEHIYYLPLTTKGCVANTALKIGEEIRVGTQNDLSAFGTDINDWQHLQLKVQNKQAEVFLNKEAIYKVDYKKDFGKIMGLAIHFTGFGSVDFVRLGQVEGNWIYSDDFN